MEKPSVAQAVLTKIKTTGLCPRSRFWYQLSNSLMWVGFIATILLGALAVSVLILAGLHGWYGLYELIGMSWAGHVLFRLTLVWPLVFVATLGLALYNFRCTKRGYRWSLWQVASVVLGLSVTLGFLLHVFGAGFTADRWLAEKMPMYPGQDRIEYGLWHQPAAGRIVGMVVGSSTSEQVTLETIDGELWTITTEHLLSEENELLRAGKKVHVVGTTTSVNTLQSCAVIPPMLSPYTTQSQLAIERAKRVEIKEVIKDCM